MVQVDLITGFLGAGKTTFLRRYAAWWAGQGVKVCVLENDFGAVNVDAMLLQDLEAQGVEMETISGGCDCDTHQRRMRTKLISMAMRGFERVIVEPSGIFDVDEFFDVLRDEPLDRWYQLGNVIAIVDALLPEELSPQAEYILASESAWAGSVLLSRCQLASDAQKQGAEAHLARALEACKCSRKFGPEEIIANEGVYNGDMGIIIDVDKDAGCLRVEIDDKEVLYDFEHAAAELELAYAVTVHKSQGNEFTAVVMPMFPGAPQLSYRNLLYTGITRAKKLLILVGKRSVVADMVANDKKTRRFSGLQHFLLEKPEEDGPEQNEEAEA